MWQQYAVVTGGNANEVVILPKLDKVIGTLDYVTKIAGASEDTLREDGSLEVEPGHHRCNK